MWSTSFCVICASSNAFRLATWKPWQRVMSSIWLTSGVSTDSPVPGMYTGFVGEAPRRRREVAPPLGGREDEGAAAVRHQAALQQVKWVADHAAIEDVFDGNQIAHHRPRHLVRPPARGDGDGGEMLVRGAG